MKKATKSWGFDTKNIDTSVRPQDDFYLYANGGWLKKNKIPADESRWGSFIKLRYDIDQQLRNILENLPKNKEFSVGTTEQLVRDMYFSASDFDKREKLGVKPIETWRRTIQSISSKKELLQCIAKMHAEGISNSWDFGVDQDAKNSSRYLLYMGQGGIGMPERDYYLLDAPEQKRVRDAYVLHIIKLLRLAGIKSKEAEQQKDVIMQFETSLALISMTKEDARDIEKTYNKKTVAQLQKEAPQIVWNTYFSLLHAGSPRQVIVMQPKFFTGIAKMIESVPLEDWKIYLEWKIINGSAGLLSKKFVEENFDFYGRTLTGAKKMRAPWRRALAAVNGTVGFALGKLYVAKHFSLHSKKLMNELVDDLFSAYGDRIQGLDWMSTPTKKRALQKLHAMNRKIGYPSKWETYRGLSIRPDDFFGNIVRASEFGHKKEMAKLRKPIDKTEWFMSPQTVNAYNHLNLNEIVFPAAILQVPFFNPEADMGVNYGAIGATIGHEITHGFDDRGSKFDGRGNMKQWWVKKDEQKFKKKTKVLEEQFNHYEVLPGLHANGKLTLPENIADLGGVSIAYYAYQKYLTKHGRKDIDGFTPEQRFFLGFAHAECELNREEFTKMITLTNEHAYSPLRVIGPVSNMQEFYDAYSVKKGDKLYREPKARAKIW